MALFPVEDTGEELKFFDADVPVRLIEILSSTDINYSVPRAALEPVRNLIKEQTGEFIQ